MSIPKVELAKCCGTCKFSNFNHQSISYYYGTKMTGLCEHPETAKIPSKPLLPVGGMYLFSTFARKYDLPEIYKKGKDWRGNKEIPPLEQYIQEEFEFNQPEERYKDNCAAVLQMWYNSWKDYNTWWKENGENVRFIHRATVCSSYEEGMVWFTTAKSLVKKAQEKGVK